MSCTSESPFEMYAPRREPREGFVIQVVEVDDDDDLGHWVLHAAKEAVVGTGPNVNLARAQRMS